MTKMKGSGREAFERRKSEIAAAVHGGTPLRAIYDKHADELEVSYSWFTRCVRALVGGIQPVTTVKPKPKYHTPQRQPKDERTFSIEQRPKLFGPGKK